MDKTAEAMDLAYEAGRILLENGAEIARVSDTTHRVAHHYGAAADHFFVLSNGIFATAQGYAHTRYIPIHGARLDKVVAVNQLSRELSTAAYTPQQFRERLDAIDHMPPKGRLGQCLGAGVGAAAFSIIFGGSLMDAVADFVVGFLLYAFVLLVSAPYLSKILGNIINGMVATLLCMAIYQVGIGSSLANIVIGAIITLVPGVPFTNGVRDISNEDYLAGITRLLDALLVFFAIALGVSITFGIQGLIRGSVVSLPAMQTNAFTQHFLIQTLVALLGTMAFSVLFSVPRRYYCACGLCGMMGWIVYLLLLRVAGLGAVSATFGGTLAVMLGARFCAVHLRCPITVFIICGIFPLVPGAGIFWTGYYAVANQMALAASSGFLALKLTIAIVLGILLLSSIPFHRRHQHPSR